MASIKFRLRKKTDNSTIYLRLSIDRDNVFEKKTGLHINSKDWSNDTGLPKQNGTGINKNLATNLKELRDTIIKDLDNALLTGVEVSTKWLGHRINIFFGTTTENEKSDYLTDAIQYIIDNGNLRENSKGGYGLSKSRINDYKRFKSLMTNYEITIDKKIKVKDVDLIFTKEMERHFVNDLKYEIGYTKRMIGNLKTVCYEAEKNGVAVNPLLKFVKTKKIKNDYVIFLTAKEIQQIEKTHILNESLNNAKKWLLLGCCLGLRGNDLLSITEKDILKFEDISIIVNKNQKTNKLSEIPLTPRVERILKDGLPRKISQQRLNDYIKLVCKQAGIDTLTEGKKTVKIEIEENGKKVKKRRFKLGTYPKHELITSHSFRRTFVTLNSGNMSNMDIMKITTHTTEKMLNNYKGDTVTDIEYLRYLKTKLTNSETKIFAVNHSILTA